MSPLDLCVWDLAPKPRTALYRPVYSAVSCAIQKELRLWTREWIEQHPEIYRSPADAKPLLVYISTSPYHATTYRSFTYDIQDPELVARAFASAGFHISRTLASLTRPKMTRGYREMYLPYKGQHLVASVRETRGRFYRLLKAETVIVDSIISFAIGGLGIDTDALDRTIRLQLSRMSDVFDFSARADELLMLATKTLSSLLLPVPPAAELAAA